MPPDRSAGGIERSSECRPTRRSILRATAAGFAGSSLLGSATATPVESLDGLSTQGNKIVDESDTPVQLNGVTVIDPSRSYRSWRGKTIDEQFDLATDEDWPHTVVRLPCRPEDIAADRTPSDTGNESMLPHGDNWGPVEPGTFDRADLTRYLADFVDPLVEHASDRGVYLLIVYDRHAPVFHQARYREKTHRDLEFWQADPYDCGTSDRGWAWDEGMCGHRGVLWHGPDQVPDIESLEDNQAKFDNPDTPDPWFDPWCGAGDGEDRLGQELDLFWETVADRYGGDSDSHVLFELFNEPTGPYFGDWGAPDRTPGGFGPITSVTGADVTNPTYANPYWELWMERSKRWLNAVAENAPERLTVVGSPRWSQWTYWAAELTFNGVNGTASLTGVDDGATNVGYAAHAHTEEALRPLAEYFGATSLVVPVLFTQFGWEAGGGPEWVSHLAGLTEVFGEGDPEAIEEWGREEGKPDPNDLSDGEHEEMNHFGTGGDYPPKEAFVGFRAFFEAFPVHPFAYSFDHTWTPRFFSAEDTDDWQLRPYSDAPGRWWQSYLEDHAADAPPGADTDWKDVPGARSATGGDIPCARDLYPDGYVEAVDGRVLIDVCTTPTPELRGRDLDDDGLYEDINENDQLDFPDVNTFFQNTDSDWVQDNPGAYDFNDDGEIDLQDVMALFRTI